LYPGVPRAHAARIVSRMEEKHADFYQNLRARIADWLANQGEGYRHARLLLVAPDLFHLLCRLALDKRVPAPAKAKLAGAIAYFVSPLDIVPELVLGPIGFLDDIAVAAYALNSVINSGQGEIAKELWAGDGDVLTLIQQILGATDEMLGPSVWKKLRSLFE
jgi:uncharacterized membrane protein YkvA (DUF1232 family)